MGPVGSYLVLDVETSGLPRDWDASWRDVDAWPRVVSIAWALHDEEGYRVRGFDTVLSSPGDRIEGTEVHGVTVERAGAYGLDRRSVLELLAGTVRVCRPTLVCHNVEFDRSAVAAELLREGIECGFHELPVVCTMRASTAYCDLRSGGGRPKWPTLEELHRTLFGTPVEGAHHAAADVAATARAYFRLRELGVVGASSSPTGAWP